MANRLLCCVSSLRPVSVQRYLRHFSSGETSGRPSYVALVISTHCWQKVTPIQFKVTLACPCSVSAVLLPLLVCHTLRALRILFRNPCMADRSTVSHCSGLQYREAFSYVHMMQAFRTALSTARVLWSLTGRRCTPQSDIQESHLAQYSEARSLPFSAPTNELLITAICIVSGNQHASKSTYPLLSRLRNLALGLSNTSLHFF